MSSSSATALVRWVVAVLFPMKTTAATTATTESEYGGRTHSNVSVCNKQHPVNVRALIGEVEVALETAAIRWKQTLFATEGQ